jgi:maltose O-acetyltransferase
MIDKSGKKLSPKEIWSKLIIRAQNVLLEIEVFFIHLISYFPSHNIRKLLYRLGGIKIGKGSAIHMGVKLYDPKNISIGADSIIGEGTVLDGRDILKIGNHVAIASQVMIYNSKHDINNEHFLAISKPVIINDYVFIGPRAIIMPGVTIGRGSIIAAGAVVTKDVSEYSIIGGVPGKRIGERILKKYKYKLGRPRLFR